MNNRNDKKTEEDKASLISSEPDLQIPTIPEDLICPLSMQIFLDPVKVPLQTITNPDGTNTTKYVTTERQVIERWIRDKGKNPFTRHPLEISELIPDVEMKVKVSDFLDLYKSSEFYESLKGKQYTPEETIERVSESVRQPTDPDADDLLAMQRAAGGVGLAHGLVGRYFFSDGSRTDTFMDFQQNRIASRGQRLIQETVMTLQSYGLTADLIREHWRPCESTAAWSEFERDALIYFVTGQSPEQIIGIEDMIFDPLPVELRLTPLEALQEITTLCYDQIQCLMHLYQQGLRGDHLRTWHGFFFFWHYHAIRALVATENMRPQDALERIRGLSEGECWDVINRQRSRVDFDMSAWQIDTAPSNRTNDEHHEVQSMRDRTTSSPGFFRRQPSQANTQMLSELEAIAWGAYRALGHANPSRDQITAASEPYIGITVADIPNFPEVIEQTPFYWPTHPRQTEPQQEQQATSLPKP